MIRVVGFALVMVVVPVTICQVDQSLNASAPALPFYDWNACPFQGCKYGEWRSQKRTILYDTWRQGRHPIAQIAAEDRLTGVTGLVITFKPGIIRMDRDLPEQDLKRGDEILTYTYRGEGYSAVWFNGRYYSQFDISFAKWPNGGGCGGAHCAATYVDLGKTAWWAEVKLDSGRLAWVDMDAADFEGVDALGTLPPR